MKQHGLVDQALFLVFKATVLSKLLYASPAWIGFLSKSTLDMYEAFLRRAVRFGYYSRNEPNVTALIASAEAKLFNKVVGNDGHVLHSLLPPKKNIPYSLRSRNHGRVLPDKDNRNFISRLLYLNTY